MRTERTFFLVIATAATLAVANLLNVTVSTSRYNESYPAVVCPPNLSGLSSAISLSTGKPEIRKTGTKSMKTRPAGISRYAISSQSAVIESGEVTPVIWQTRKGVWAGAAPCTGPITSQWFVGATADITSKGSLNLVNSGLGKAVITVNVFTENGAVTPRDVVVGANSFLNLPLVSLAPGSKKIAIHIKPKSGRVNGFVIDERGRGLRSLGGDILNSTADPVKVLQIPAIPQQVNRNQATPHTLRLYVPGAIDARISAEIRSTDGTFSPISINGKVIPNQKVVEIPMKIKMAAGKFALHITSDQPILGSVFTQTVVQGKSDFIWSTHAPDLQKFTLATNGLAPNLVFTGKEIKVSLDLLSSSGKTKRVEIRGEDIATYTVAASTRSVTFTNISKGTSGAALISSKSGSGYIPLAPGSVLTKSSIPSSNISVLIP
ncbi:Protein of unknown function DUF5719 [Candidatus Nanopelagicaceae bacterium]